MYTKGKVDLYMYIYTVTDEMQWRGRIPPLTLEVVLEQKGRFLLAGGGMSPLYCILSCILIFVYIKKKLQQENEIRIDNRSAREYNI